jgi:hypothetical protein
MYIDKFTSTVGEMLSHVRVLSIVKLSTECKKISQNNHSQFKTYKIRLYNNPEFRV